MPTSLATSAPTAARIAASVAASAMASAMAVPTFALAALLAVTPSPASAATFTPLTQSRVVFASANADSQSWPNGSCPTPGFDEQTVGLGASNFLLYEDVAEASATTPCASTLAASTQSSNMLVSSLVASGSVSTESLATAFGSSGGAAATSFFDIFFETTTLGPVKVEGFLFAEASIPTAAESSWVSVQLLTGGGTLLFAEEIHASPDGIDAATLSWSSYLVPGQYRFVVYASATAEVIGAGLDASATYDVRLVSCSPWCTPPNDQCWGALPAGEGVNAFSTINATDSPDAAGLCTLEGDDRFRSDVWYETVAACTGPLTVSTCGGTALDTTLAVYQGGPCPQDPADLVPLGCDDDGCGDQSSVTVAATAGTPYLIRIGGRQGVQGTGTFTVECAAVLGDLDGDGDVDGADLGLLLGAWGQAGGDLDGDGLTNGADLGLLLGAWTG